MKASVCRSCGSDRLLPVLDLGETPLANSLLTAEQVAAGQEGRFPLCVVRCAACTLVQLDYTVPPEAMFSHYVYFSSFSTTMLEHARRLVERVVAERGLTGAHRVIEIASNDGYLLQYYKQAGVEVLGIEPAENVAQAARDQRGIPTVSAFFGQALAERLAAEGTLADVVHGHNVMAHVPDINGFIGGLKAILKPSGVVIIEAPYLADLLDGAEFDTIYHEHFFYFSLTALVQAFARHGLTLFDVERVPIHGGSLRIFAGHAGAVSVSERVTALLAEEAAWGVDDERGYAAFAQQVATLREALTGALAQLKAEGKQVAVYGASAKGSTLLNTFGIGSETLAFVVDRSTVKQGLYTPGTHLPILPPSALLEHMPDVVLLLTWNFADEILAQQAEYLARGGRFLIPLPTLRMVPS
jgi:SAM-dependent methyltransferase